MKCHKLFLDCEIEDYDLTEHKYQSLFLRLQKTHKENIARAISRAIRIFMCVVVAVV